MLFFGLQCFGVNHLWAKLEVFLQLECMTHHNLQTVKFSVLLFEKTHRRLQKTITHGMETWGRLERGSKVRVTHQAAPSAS